MKMIFTLFFVLFGLNLFASSETKTFFYDGTQNQIQLILQAEKTYTEYRYEQRQTICQRQEVFYRTICRTDAQGRRVCQQVPQYRTISYPCIQTIQIPYEVKEYDVEAKADINVASLPVETAGETFKVTLNGDQLTLKALGSRKYFIILKNQDLNSSIQGNFKMINASYVVELVEASPILNALNFSEISLKDTLLNFKSGPLADKKQIGFYLKVKKAPLLGSDTILFDRELTSGEIELSNQEKVTSANINLSQLGIQLTDGRYSLTATAFFKFKGSILNSSEFEETQASKTLIYKVR